MNKLNNRIPPPVLFTLVALAMWAASLLIPHSDIVGTARWPLTIGFVVLGLIGPLGILEFRNAKTTIDPVRIERATALVTKGAFRLTRNPMYVSMASLLVSFAFYLGVPWTFLGPLMFVLFITRFQIIPEEKAMTAKFGDEYAVYKLRVRRWL